MPLSNKEQNIGAIITCLVILLFSVYVGFSTIGFSNVPLLLSVLGTALLSAISLCIFLIRKYRKEDRPLVIDYLNIGTQRYLLGLFMIFYGVSKLFGNFFDYQLSALDSRLADVSEFELAWYFFGKNRWQELLIGIMEFVPGILLLHRRSYYVASLILFPVTLQVFLLNLFFKIGGITFPAATILLACNVYIIYSQKEKIILFFRSLDFSPGNPIGGLALSLIRVFKWTGILLAVMIVMLQFRRFFKSPYGIKYERLVGVYTLQEIRKNNALYDPVKDSLRYKTLYIEKQSRWNMLRRFNDKTDAFVLGLDTKNDSIAIYINKGGIGDDPDIIDSATVLKGTYKLDHDVLSIQGIQLKDTLQLKYRKQDIRGKKWFW